MSSRKTVGLALGSGSSSGWAHIGAIEALEEENIPIDYVAGSSVGSYVGALYASGSLKSLKEFVLRMDGKKVFSYFDVVFPRSGILDGTKRLKELFSIHTAVEDFSELNIPVMMVDPVPVGVARALEADIVIAVDLSSTVASRKKPKRQTKPVAKKTWDSLGYKSELLKKILMSISTAALL